MTVWHMQFGLLIHMSTNLFWAFSWKLPMWLLRNVDGPDPWLFI